MSGGAFPKEPSAPVHRRSDLPHALLRKGNLDKIALLAQDAGTNRKFCEQLL